MKRKLAAISMCAVLIGAMTAGCSGTSSESATSKESASASSQASSASSQEASSLDGDSSIKSYNFAGDIVGQGAAALDDLVDEESYIFNSMNSKFQIYNDNFTADTQGTNVQTMASSGYDGMMIFGWNATLYTTINDISSTASVPYVIFDQIPQDQEVIDQLSMNQYYVGSVGVDNYSGAGVAAQEMYDAGITKVILVGGSVGDVVHDSREKGFTEKFEELGGEVLGVARCSDPSEATTKTDDLLSAYPDAQGAYCFTGDYAVSALSALDNYSSLDLKVYCSDTTAESIPYIIDGSIVRGDSGSKIAAILAATLLYNYANGNPILDEEGNAPLFNNIVSFTVDASNAQEYDDKFLSGHPFTAEGIQEFIQEDVTYQTYVDYISEFSMDTLK